ncbi:MAG TPA: HD domain-containing protein [Bacteriovoracaceae bacterium]|nr:HD domain-containing protein [Bacteriovoracaceae bacterium]
MQRLQTLIPLVKPYYQGSDPAHDWPHIGRVAATAKKIALSLKANLPCVLAAVYCHDLINLPKDHPERKNASTLSANEALPYLVEAGFDQQEISLIQKGIIEHSFSKGLRPTCIEAAIVQDADRLDALGAIGVLRCAAVNAQMKSSFYDPQDPEASARPLDDKAFMLDHYFVKLFKLPELMNTDEARLIAEGRIVFMKQFISNLLSEVR